MDKPKASGVTLAVPMAGPQAAQDAREASRSASDTAEPASAYLNGLVGGRRTQRSALRSLAILLGYRTPFEVPWSAVTAAELRGIRARLRTLYAGATTNRIVSALRGVLKLAHAGNLPADVQEALKGNEDAAKSDGRALGPRELGKLLAAAPPTKAGLRDAAIVATMCGSGLRRDSIVKLDVGDYDGQHRILTAQKAKAGKTYETALAAPLAPFVERWLEQRGGDPGPLFPRILPGNDLPTRKRLSVQAVSDIIERLRVKAGVDPFTPHDLRRTFGTSLLDAGVDPVAVARLMGHESVNTTMRYDRRQIERLAEVVNEKIPKPEEP